VWSSTIADRLHEGVADRRADEAEAASFEILGERVESAVRDGTSADERGSCGRLPSTKAPEVGVEARDSSPS
jgi:hypothetical protein